MYTILALIMWSGDLVAEDFGSFDTIEHCAKVQIELDTKLTTAGAKVVSVCIPAVSNENIVVPVPTEEVRG